MATLTQIRACNIGACSEPVPTGLTQQGVCLSHYLDDAFTQVAAALELCQRGQTIGSSLIEWLAAQGDFAVFLLSKDQGQSSEQRTRLLELLLCLANVQEHLRHQPVPQGARKM